MSACLQGKPFINVTLNFYLLLLLLLCQLNVELREMDGKWLWPVGYYPDMFKQGSEKNCAN